MENLIYWMIAGGLFGFIRAWKKTTASYTRAKDGINSTPIQDKILRANSLGYIRGLRLGALIISTIVGIALGAAIWGVSTFLARLIGA